MRGRCWTATSTPTFDPGCRSSVGQSGLRSPSISPSASRSRRIVSNTRCNTGTTSLLSRCPLLRPLRLLRLLALLRLLNRTAAGSLVGRVTTYVTGVAVMSIGLGAIAVLDVEQDHAGANITTFGDALWWATTTVTTVGYGDRYPVTTPGRFIAVVLMLVGIAVVGTVTGSVAAWLVTNVKREEQTPQPATETTL
ncbi:potassium channel family protein [Antrihabitans spumae]|uniref:Potassium channel family protein n=1 Tax=Antrihabitans spumae TaxID=3373370 RepID=A0ABW7JNF9_9NOCA